MTVPAEDSDFVDLVAAGDGAKGAFHCAECGYGVTVTRTLPVCPMCSGVSWERASWSRGAFERL